MKKLCISTILSVMWICVFAQQPQTLKGHVLNHQNQPIAESATVSLFYTLDSALVKMALTDSTGLYIFEGIVPGNYFIRVSTSEMSPYSGKNFVVGEGSEPQKMAPILLQDKATQLASVTVTARKKFIERKIDKTVLNMDAALTYTGSTILEVLEKAPGVNVDKDGNISLRGKSSVIVMIDGKPTYMSQADLSNYLGSIPVSNLDQIELMTNPSAKYDASGNAGIINIITKKIKQKGFNGSLALAYGYSDYSKTNNSLNLNYRQGKLNLFSNLSANQREQFQTMHIYREYLRNDKSLKAIFDQDTDTKKERGYYNIKLGADYYLNQKTTLGIVLTGVTAPGNEIGSSVSFLKNAASFTDSIVTADRKETRTWKDFGVNVNFRKVLDSNRKEFSVDVDYMQYDANTVQNFFNHTYQGDWSPKNSDILQGNLPRDIQIYMLKSDYSQQLNGGLKFETGVKSSYVHTLNGANYFTVLNDVPSIDYSKTNHFRYNENINAAYINFNKTIKKWGLQFGLRAENVNYAGKQFGNPTQTDSSFQKSYTSLFPTAYVQLNANEKNQFGLSLGRRISRPDYEDLNPFLFFLDKYTYEEGNVYLRPMYSHVIEVTHTYHQFLNSSFSFNHTTDMFEDVFRQNNVPGDSISTIISSENFGKSDVISLSVSAELKPAKWWRSTLYTEGRYKHYQATVREEEIDIEGANLMFHINNQFTFKKGWAAEVSGFYMTNELEGQIRIDRVMQLDIAIKKDILKRKGSLKLSVRDLFGPMHVDGKFGFGHTRVQFAQVRDSRVLSLGFNYRFGKPIKGLKSRKSSTSDEQNRIGGE